MFKPLLTKVLTKANLQGEEEAARQRRAGRQRQQRWLIAGHFLWLKWRETTIIGQDIETESCRGTLSWNWAPVRSEVWRSPNHMVVGTNLRGSSAKKTSETLYAMTLNEQRRPQYLIYAGEPHIKTLYIRKMCWRPWLLCSYKTLTIHFVLKLLNGSSGRYSVETPAKQAWGSAKMMATGLGWHMMGKKPLETVCALRVGANSSWGWGWTSI